jgi:vibriolysin
LVEGGAHPQSKTTVVVPGIGFEAAADIFYAANVACLTPSSNFAGARYCTADVHGGSNAAAVNAAWDAVGVPSNDPPPPPNPPIALTDGVALGNQDAATGNYQPYTLVDVASGSTVTCSTSCNNGDADLYLRFGQNAEANPNSTANECGSYSEFSNESCTTGAAPSATTLFAAVHAYAGFSNLSIICTETKSTVGACILEPVGASCTLDSECCSNSCKGRPGGKTCK